MRLQRGVDALGGAELLVERERLEVGRVAPGRGLGFDKPRFTETALSFFGVQDDRDTHSDWSSKRGGSSSSGFASSNAIRSASVCTPDGFLSSAAKYAFSWIW